MPVFTHSILERMLLPISPRTRSESASMDSFKGTCNPTQQIEFCQSIKKFPNLFLNLIREITTFHYFWMSSKLKRKSCNETHNTKTCSETDGSDAVFQSQVDLASLPAAIDWRQNVRKYLSVLEYLMRSLWT